MNYPLVSEYIDSIMYAEENFATLTNLRPVLDNNGMPIMSNGNFAVVFKMQDCKTGAFYALKCFTKDQNRRERAYKKIEKELSKIKSCYLLNFKYLKDELFVYSASSYGLANPSNMYPVLLMDWKDGLTLESYLRKYYSEKYDSSINWNIEGITEKMYEKFKDLASWLLSQPFAHGDLKPDNIIVSNDELYLIDYDGMFVPSMRGEKPREFGTPDFRHPMYKKMNFDSHIDDFPIIILLLSLKALSLKPKLYNKFGCKNGNIFVDSDYYDISNSMIMPELCKLLFNSEFQQLFGLFNIVLSEGIINPQIASNLYPDIINNLDLKGTHHKQPSSLYDRLDIFKKQILKVIDINGFSSDSVGIYYTESKKVCISLNPRRYNRIKIGVGYQCTWNEYNCDLEDFDFSMSNWGDEKFIRIKIKDEEIVKIPIKEFEKNSIRLAGEGWTHFSIIGEHFYSSEDEYGDYRDL